MEPYYTLDELIQLSHDGKLRNNSDNFEKKAQETRQASSGYENVHVYEKRIPKYEPRITFDPNYKREVFEKLKSILENPYSKVMVDLFVQGHDIIDHIDGINCSELLADILSRKMTKDIFFLLEEQLADNYLLGTCNIGKSVRLIQIYNMLVQVR